MAYLIDTSSLIEARDRMFCLDVCPGFWDWLDQQNIAGKVFSIEAVRRELESVNDDLRQWAVPRSSRLFLQPDAAVVRAVTDVSQWTTTTDFQRHVCDEFLRGADPFLVAHARVYGHVIVTDEKFKPEQRNKITIPAACRQFGVAYMLPLEMLRQEGVRFVLPTPPDH